MVDYMAKAPRRFITRACGVCEWSAGAVEEQAATHPGCPWCHAPTHVVREEWLLDVTEMRARSAAFGRKGGLKGGRARADRLSPKQRSEIARKAAAARWKRR